MIVVLQLFVNDSFEIFPYILNILASIAVISKLVDISEVKKNIFLLNITPKSSFGVVGNTSPSATAIIRPVCFPHFQQRFDHLKILNLVFIFSLRFTAQVVVANPAGQCGHHLRLQRW